jgi:lipid A 3-O-deacylase
MDLKTTTAIAATLLLPALTANAQPAPDTASIWTLQDENASISA